MYRQSEEIAKHQYLFTRPHNMVNVRPLTAEIGSLVWSTPANFNRFRVLASLLHRRRSMEVNSTTLCTMFGRLLGWYTIYIFGRSCRNVASCKIHFLSKSCVLPYWHLYFTALKQRPSAKLCGVAQGMELRNFLRRRQYIQQDGRHVGYIGSHSSYLLQKLYM